MGFPTSTKLERLSTSPRPGAGPAAQVAGGSADAYSQLEPPGAVAPAAGRIIVNLIETCAHVTQRLPVAPARAPESVPSAVGRPGGPLGAGRHVVRRRRPAHRPLGRGLAARPGGPLAGDR